MIRSLRTYDVFDTCVTRIAGKPISVFLLLGHDLVAKKMWAGSAEQFASARVECETRARVHVSPREVRFAEIYFELQRSYALGDADVRDIASSELAMEKSLLRPVPGILEELNDLRAKGCIVQFVSDMYLPYEVLRAWLTDLKILKEDEPLWLSSRHGVTKHEGAIFDLVRSSFEGAGLDWTHIGDNAWSDVAVPTSRGITARHRTDCDLTESELAMEAASLETCGLSSLFAGAARWARLRCAEELHSSMVHVATGVGGPLIYAFVHWVLLEAQRRSLKKIWFMARDGQVMLPVARMIAERLGLDLEFGYLYGGRQVVRVASLMAVDEHALVWLTGGAGVMTLQAVLDRVGISVNDVTAPAAAAGLPVDGVLGWENVEALKTFLQNDDVSALILERAAERREVVLDYFRASGLIGGGSCGVVDIGWKGNVLRSIVDLIGIDAAKEHTFMYFGSYAHAKGCESIPKAAYLFDVVGDCRIGIGEDIPSMTTLMEVFCQADHGQVMEVRRRGAEFEPLCRPTDNFGLARWDVRQFQHAVFEFALAVPIERFSAVNVDMRRMCAQLLRRLAVNPSAEEIALLGPIGFVDDQGGSQPQPFAYAYGFRHLRLAFRTGNSAPLLGLNWWTAAAQRLTPPAVRLCMHLAARAGKIQMRNRSVFSRNRPAAT